jgi:tetratricopeptide (TPR) repeat protein
MLFLIPVLIVMVLIVGVSAVVWFASTQTNRGGFKRGIKKSKSKEDAIRIANKRIAKNPKDAGALNFLGSVYFESEDWANAHLIYEKLAEIPPTNNEFDQVEVNVRAGCAALHLNNLEAAYKYLVVAKALAPTNQEANYQLGNLEFQRGNYEKAAQMIQQALSQNPDHAPALRTLGHALFRLKRIKEAMGYIRKAIEFAPGDKESLFTLAECYAESGQKDQALRIYSHLRPDEHWGAQACLASGLIHADSHQDEAAIADFEIGLKHSEIKDDIKAALLYETAAAYLRLKDITTAMTYLQQVKILYESYRETNELIESYKELSANQNLQIYSLGSSADFVALCRKIVMTYYQKARAKITKTAISANDWADITAEVDTPKWSNIVMFRFIRTQGTIGELVVRDFQSHLKDSKADKGVCAGIGSYSDEARKFTEARLIDLVDREKLIAILNGLDIKLQTAALK